MKRSQIIRYRLAALAAFVSLIVYLAALRNDFIDLDDVLYVLENPHIRSFNGTFLRWAFFDFYAANWHPLTWMSHALDYTVWGLDPFGHHLTNVVLHAVNTFLVSVLVIRLLDAHIAKGGPAVKEIPVVNPGSRQQNLTSYDILLNDRTALIAAGTTGLLFGLHPLHVESVAWVSERKDLLCAFFFLLSILSYVSYLSHKTYKTYFLALGFFILALLSKPMAVTLPLVLLILDWHPFSRIRSSGTFLTACIEKLPFLAFSLISSIITIMAQKSGEALASTAMVPAPARLLVAVKSLVVYLLKMIVPYNLVPFYSYPSPGEASFRHAAYSLSFVLVIVITAASIMQIKKQKVWPAVWFYFVLTLLPVIGIMQVGGQAMADRYAYLPSLGPFLVMGLAFAWIWKKADVQRDRRTIKVLSVIAVVFVFASLTCVTIRQIGVWKNSAVFWDYVIEKEPNGNSLAYNNRGILYGKQGLYDKALDYLNRSIAISANCIDCFYNRAITYSLMGRDEKALEDFNKALALNQNLPDAYVNRGNLYMKSGQKELALADYRKACELGNKQGCNAVSESAPRRNPPE